MITRAISVFSDYFHAVFVIPPLNPLFAAGTGTYSLRFEASRMIGLFSGFGIHKRICKLEFGGADLSNPVGADAHIGPLHMV